MTFPNTRAGGAPLPNYCSEPLTQRVPTVRLRSAPGAYLRFVLGSDVQNRRGCRAGIASVEDSLPQSLLGWVLGCAFVYSGLFGTGSLLYGRMPQFAMWLAVFVVSGVGLARVLRGFWTPETSEP